MADPKNVVLGIITPRGPVTLSLTMEEFAAFVESLNHILDDLREKTPIPEVFVDAFTKEE